MNTRLRNKLRNAVIVCFVLTVFLIYAGPAKVALAAGETIMLPEKPSFTDLTADSPLYPYVRYLTEKGIIKGYPDGSFRPTEGVTRAEAARVMVLAKGLQPVKDIPPTFSDISPDYWAYGEIEAATKAGLFRGYPDGTFNPEGIITRAEAITLLTNLSGGALSGKTMFIGDVGPDHWAYRQVVTAVEAGLVQLSPENLFEPDQDFCRGDLARSLSVMFTLSPALRAAELTGKLTVKKGPVNIIEGNGVSREINGEALVGAGAIIITGEQGQAEITFDDGSGILIDAGTEIDITKSQGFAYMRTDGSPGVAVDKLDIHLVKGKIYGALATRYEKVEQSAGEKKTAYLDGVEGKYVTLASTQLPPGISDILLAENEPATSENNSDAWWQEPYAERERVTVDMPWGVAGIRGTFWMNEVSATGQSTAVITGHAVVSSAGQTVSVTAGQATTITSAGAPPAPPAPLSQSQQQALAMVRDWVTQRAQEIQNNLPPPPAPAVLPPNVPVEQQQQQQNQSTSQQPETDIVGIVTQSFQQATSSSNSGGGNSGSSNVLTFDTTHLSGSTFTIPVNISNASDIYAVSIKILFDKTLLQAVSVQPNNNAFPLEVVNETNNDTGYVRLVISKEGAVTGISGTNQICAITFNAIGSGSSSLSFSEASLCDSNGALISPNIQNASIAR